MVFAPRFAPPSPLAMLWLSLLLSFATPSPALGADLDFHVGIARESTLPLASLNNGVLSGLAIDLTRLLTEQLSMELKLSLLPQRDLLNALKGGRIDAILSSEEEEAELRALRLLPSTPLLQTGQLALVRQEDLNRYPRKIDVLSTQGKVGYERGTMAARVVHQQMPKAERVPFPDASQALHALKQGQTDLLVLDAMRAWNLLADPQEDQLAALLDPLVRQNLTWVVRETDIHLLARINSSIAQWRQAGTLAHVISRWIPMRILPGEQ